MAHVCMAINGRRQIAQCPLCAMSGHSRSWRLILSDAHNALRRAPPRLPDRNTGRLSRRIDRPNSGATARLSRAGVGPHTNLLRCWLQRAVGDGCFRTLTYPQANHGRPRRADEETGVMIHPMFTGRLRLSSRLGRRRFVVWAGPLKSLRSVTIRLSPNPQMQARW
jgi:hypothetical protein